MSPIKQPGSFEKKWQQLGQSVDRKIDQGKQKIKQAKESVSRGYEQTKAHLNTIKTKARNKIDHGIQTAKNTYRSVSNSVKNTIDAWRERAKQTVDSITNSVHETVIALANYKDQLAQDVQKWIVKGIQFVKNTGTLIVDYWTKKVNILIGNIKNDFNRAKNAIERWVVTSIQLTKDGLQFLDKSRKAVIKYSTAVAVATGLLVYSGWKLMVNTGIETALKISQQVKEANALIISSIKNNTLKAIKFANQGKDVVIQYGNKVKVISRDVALKAGLIVTEGASYVLNKAHQGVQHLNRNLQENLQAGKDGVSLWQQRVAGTPTARAH